MRSRKQNKKQVGTVRKNIAIELGKARNLNNQLIKQLMVVSNSPESEPAKAIVEHYKNVLTQMKNDTTINPDSNSTGEANAIQSTESGTKQADKGE